MAAKKKEIRVVAGPGRADAAGRDPRAGDPAEAEADAADRRAPRPKPRASWCAPCARTRASWRAHDPRHRRTAGRRAQPRDAGKPIAAAQAARRPGRSRSLVLGSAATAARRAELGGREVDAVLAVEHAAARRLHGRRLHDTRSPRVVQARAARRSSRRAHLPDARLHAARRGAARSRAHHRLRRRDAGIAGRVHAADVPGQAGRRRRAARADAALRRPFQIGAFRADARRAGETPAAVRDRRA